ncbi:hypothetical protein PV08_08505 [Exophiala spinifera]|uniref:Ecp2 effector protein domain-containing protein n=1 Tax=Exophiala spinifera TaxID=91928 RepID=A0A0D1ZKF7_9EURO|nr:uncharacterized protein PV08_08505 [Exophiala spinifera]KIW13317.1 hypothetical protein PV08_08505 [Exophiala spinifera]
MRFNILVLVLSAFAMLTEAYVASTGTKNLNLNNDQIAQNASAATAQLQLNIDPDITNPNCGGIYPANINVKYGPDPFYLSDECRAVLSWLGGNDGKQDVDIVWTCTGQMTAGPGDRNTYIILNTAPNVVFSGSGGNQQIGAYMEIHRLSDGFFTTAAVYLQAKTDPADNKATFQFIFC